MESIQDIKELIPQREPFLFIENILQIEKNTITVETTFPKELDFFKGHFPGDPIVPGVILSEHCFQSGAALISSQSISQAGDAKENDFKDALAVVSRIQSAKFKSIVRPDQKITTKTIITDQIDNAAFFKSIIKNEEGKKVLIIEFACTLITE